MLDARRLRSHLLATLAVGLLAACDRGSPEPAPVTAKTTKQPDTEQLDTKQPDTKQPDAEQPDTKQPDTEQLDTKQLDTKQPDTKQPDTKQPDTKQPERPDALDRPKRPRPTCPTGHWCGDASAARPLAKGKTEKLACPEQLKFVQGVNMADPEYRGLEFIREPILDVSATQTKRDAGDDDTCCYRWTIPCPGGRPVLDARGELVRPALRAVVDHPETRARAIAGWLDDARSESASIASFERVVAELRAVGAPAELVAAAAEAARDEARHTALCLDAARQLGARDITLGPREPAPPRPANLVRLAVDTFVEGAVGETMAALAATRAAARCELPQIRAALLEIAQDETRHAALAWQTLAWAVERGGAPVIEALRSEARRAGAALDPEGDDARAGSAEAGLEPLGRLEPAALAEVRRDVWREVIQPLLAAVA